MNDCSSRPQWMQDLESGLRRLNELVAQENQALRTDPKQKLHLVMDEGQRVLATRIANLVNLKKELKQQLQKNSPPAQKRPRALPPRRPAPMSATA